MPWPRLLTFRPQSFIMEDQSDANTRPHEDREAMYEVHLRPWMARNVSDVALYCENVRFDPVTRLCSSRVQEVNPVRIVTWNCCRGGHGIKMPPLLQLKPDIAVLQETPRPSKILGDGQTWKGTNPRSGVLVLSFNGYTLEPARIRRKEPEVFVPVRIAGPRSQFNLLAAWVKPGRKPYYRSTVDDAIDLYDSFIREAPTVVLGDLNTYYRFYDWTGQTGLISAYHEYFHTALGKEAHATFYRYRRRASRYRYHYDYCFIPGTWKMELKRVRVGSYDKWASLSDHMPVIVDLK